MTARNRARGRAPVTRSLVDHPPCRGAGIGVAFRQRCITPHVVLTSRWCLARETADLALPGRRQDEPAFDSSLDMPDPTTEAAHAVLAARAGPAALVVVTHQLNVTDSTGIIPPVAEGIVLRWQLGNVEMIGPIEP